MTARQWLLVVVIAVSIAIHDTTTVTSDSDDLAAGSDKATATSSPAETVNGEIEVDAAVPYSDLFNTVGRTYQVDPRLLAAIGFCESSYRPDVSSGKADGLMQFTPSTAAEYGVNVWDPASAIDGAARYLLDSITELNTTDPALLAASYNAGRRAVREAGGIPNNNETPGYVTCVTTNLGGKP